MGSGIIPSLPALLIEGKKEERFAIAKNAIAMKKNGASRGDESRARRTGQKERLFHINFKRIENGERKHGAYRAFEMKRVLQHYHNKRINRHKY